MSDRVGIGLIGVGRLGATHARNLAFRVPETALRAIADTNEGAVRSVAAECRVEKWTTDYHDLLEDDSIQGIVIASSTNMHADIIRDAARAGKAIFCEKPLDLDLKRIDDALSEVARSGVKFQMGFNRRFDPSYVKAERLIRNGTIGKPYLLKITNRDPEPASREYIAVSGGLYLDTTIHDFDIARYLMGCEVEEVFATGSVLVSEVYAEFGDVDTGITTLRFTNGVLGVIDNCRQAVYGYDVRAEILGSEGSIAVGNPHQTMVEQHTRAGLQRDNIHYWFLERFAQAYIDEMRHFAQCIAHDETPRVGGYDGKRSVELGLAAWTSFRERRLVRL